MKTHQHLTNQEFSDAYDNKFKLALEIIDIAQRSMLSGDEVSLGKLINDARRQAILKLEGNTDENE